MTEPWWPSSVWFMLRLLGTDPPGALPTSRGESSFNTLSKPSSPPDAIQPWSGFQASECSTDRKSVV